MQVPFFFGCNLFTYLLLLIPPLVPGKKKYIYIYIKKKDTF